jgi:uncharacterized membrane protein YpjA
MFLAELRATDSVSSPSLDHGSRNVGLDPVGTALTAHYFQGVEHDHLREGIMLAAVWIVLNWLLDIVALLPFTKQSLPRYFAEIGLRYLAIAAPAVAVGYVLHHKARLTRQGP